MDNLKTQFLGFINTASLFEELHSLTQFEIDMDEIKNFDLSKLHVPDNISLGRRIEHFFEFYIKESPNYELIKSNIQIIDKKETLGELDFLIYDKREKRYLHIEHIYKYYLYDTSFSNEIDRYIGPNRNDTLVKKLQKLKDKQLPLLFKDETQKYIKEIDLNNIEQKVCFKGNIYVPLGLEGEDIPIVNSSCIKGFYLSYEEFLSKTEFKGYLYFLPHRNDWVSDSSTNETWKTFDEASQEISTYLNLEKSPLVWLKDTKENKTKSFFITYY